MALVGVGSVINSSLVLKQGLEEVMDRLIALMGAERGILREPCDELNVHIARGIAREDLNKEAFAVSNSIVRRAIEIG